MPLITVSIIQLPPREDAQHGFDVPNHYRKTKAKMSQNLFSNAALTSFFFKHIYHFYVCYVCYVCFFILCKVLHNGCKKQKSTPVAGFMCVIICTFWIFCTCASACLSIKCV